MVDNRAGSKRCTACWERSPAGSNRQANRICGRGEDTSLSDREGTISGSRQLLAHREGAGYINRTVAGIQGIERIGSTFADTQVRFSLGVLSVVLAEHQLIGRIGTALHNERTGRIDIVLPNLRHQTKLNLGIVIGFTIERNNAAVKRQRRAAGNQRLVINRSRCIGRALGVEFRQIERELPIG